MVSNVYIRITPDEISCEWQTSFTINITEHRQVMFGNRHSRLSPAEHKNFHTTWKMCRLGTSVVITCYLWYRPRYLMLQTGLLQQGSCSQELQGLGPSLPSKFALGEGVKGEGVGMECFGGNEKKHSVFYVQKITWQMMEIHQDVIPHAIEGAMGSMVASDFSLAPRTNKPTQHWPIKNSNQSTYPIN